jgi:hypothetical protein
MGGRRERKVREGGSSPALEVSCVNNEQGLIEVRVRCTHLQLLIISFDETFLVTFFTLPCLGARALLIH